MTNALIFLSILACIAVTFVLYDWLARRSERRSSPRRDG
jgi:hypothetical protein